jgi:hypothetical protein
MLYFLIILSLISINVTAFQHVIHDDSSVSFDTQEKQEQQTSTKKLTSNDFNAGFHAGFEDGYNVGFLAGLSSR